MGGYNENFESYVNSGSTYSTYYIKFNDFDRSAYQWGDYVYQDSMVIIAVLAGGAFETALETVLNAGLGTVSAINGACVTTTSTTTTIWPSTSTTSTRIP
jgi:hypothetical protein